VAERAIVVAGAGIAGLAVAGALQRAGRPVLVLEEREEVSELGAGITLWPNALAALDALGLGDRVRDISAAVDPGGVRRPDGRWQQRLDAGRARAVLGEQLRATERGALVQVLADRVDRASIRTGTAVRRFDLVRDVVEVHLDTGQVVEATALVGADGFRSLVARTLDPEVRERYAGYTAWRAIAPIEVPPVAATTNGEGCEVGYVSIGGGQTYWFATEPAPEGSTSTGGELEHLRSRFAHWHEPIPTLAAATEGRSVIRHDIVDRTIPRTWGRGAVTLVGDAAHAMRPHLGQGGCQALEGAAELVRVLTGAGRADLPGALRSYEVARRRRARPIVRRSRMLGRVTQQVGLRASVLDRAAAVIPQRVVLHQLASVAARSAWPVA
jgi:2-polyprenyl-6-methoxyphenol hydroxylase-like FAD-dependent oxidoreductase